MNKVKEDIFERAGVLVIILTRMFDTLNPPDV